MSHPSRREAVVIPWFAELFVGLAKPFFARWHTWRGSYKRALLEVHQFVSGVAWATGRLWGLGWRMNGFRTGCRWW